MTESPHSNGITRGTSGVLEKRTPPPALKISKSSTDVGRVKPLTQSRSTKYEIDFQTEIELQDLLGRGAHGEVYRAKYHGTTVAVKKIINTAQLNEDVIEDFMSEISLMSSMRPHPNICLFYGYSRSPLCIVMEFLPGGSLESLLEQKKKIPLSQKLGWMRDIASGMYHLQLGKLVHKDLATRNVLIARDLSAKVTDFGLSRLSDSHHSNNSVVSETKVGPLKWMAPESLQLRKFSVKSDVWSFCITSVEILTQLDPYPGLDPVQVATGVCLGTLSISKDIPKTLHKPFYEMLLRCLETDPEKRPDFKEITDIFETHRSLYEGSTEEFVKPALMRTVSGLSLNSTPPPSASNVYGMTPSFVNPTATPSNRSNSVEMSDEERWEQRTDQNGRPYFVDHLLKTTTYSPPPHLTHHASRGHSGQSNPIPSPNVRSRDAPPLLHINSTTSLTTPHVPPPSMGVSMGHASTPIYSATPASVQYVSYPNQGPFMMPHHPYVQPAYIYPYAQPIVYVNTPVATQPSSNSKEPKSLPQGWVALLDPQGRTYYHNNNLKLTTYDYPSQ